MVNKVFLIGNLGRDPEIRHLDSGVAVGKFSLATNESYKDNNDEWQTITEWHEIVVWRNLAERAEKTLKKGNQVYIEGKIRTRKWTDQDGNDKYTTEIICNLFRLLEKRERSEGSFPNTEESSSGVTGSSKVEDSTSGEQQGDDLPF